MGHERNGEEREKAGKHLGGKKKKSVQRDPSGPALGGGHWWLGPAGGREPAIGDPMRSHPAGKIPANGPKVATPATAMSIFPPRNDIQRESPSWTGSNSIRSRN